MVTVDKKLYLCFQKKDWSLGEYTREFNAQKEVSKEIGGTLGNCLESNILQLSKTIETNIL